MPSNKKRNLSTEVTRAHDNTKIQIGMDYNLIEKKKSMCKDIQKTKNQCLPKKLSDLSWFSFSSYWYPIILVDVNNKNNKLINKTSIKMEIISNDNDEIEPYSINTHASNGVYWFRDFNSHLLGSVTLRFSCSDINIEDLTYQIQIVRDPSGICDEYNKKLSIEKEQSMNITNEFINPTNENNLKTKKRKQENKIKPNSHSSLPTSTSVNILPYPKFITLTSNHRIEIPIVLNNNTTTTTTNSNSNKNTISSIQHQHDFIDLNNNLLKCKLSKSLIYAIVRDRETLMLQNSYTGINKNDSKEKGINNSILKNNLNNPSVKELLHTIQCQCIESIPNFNSNNSNIIEQLFNLFEYCFEDYLLYPSEKEALYELLDEIKNNKELYADYFGAYHFLRFLIFLVTSTDVSIEALMNDSDTVTVEDFGYRSSRSTKFQGSFVTDKPTNTAIASSTSIAKKKDNITIKKDKDMKITIGMKTQLVLKEIQHVVDVSFMLLDEQAHVLFY